MVGSGIGSKTHRVQTRYCLYVLLSKIYMWRAAHGAGGCSGLHSDENKKYSIFPKEVNNVKPVIHC